MPEEVGPPNGAATPNFSRAASSSVVVQAGKARAHLAVSLGALLRGDAVEQEAGGLALRRVPGGRPRGDEIGLRAQDHAVLDHLEPVGGERRAGGGDVDDQFGGAGGRRAFGRAGALDDAVVDDAVLGEEAAGRG